MITVYLHTQEALKEIQRCLTRPDRKRSLTFRQKESPKEEPERKRKGVKSDFEETFVRKSALTARQGKQVYIRKEFHDRILKITQVIGQNEITIADYLDNVMAHHFGQFQNDVAESFNRHIKSYNNL